MIKFLCCDLLNRENVEEFSRVQVFPASHYVASEERLKNAIEAVREELQGRLQFYRKKIMYKEAERLEQRTCLDLEMLSEMGFLPWY